MTHLDAPVQPSCPLCGQNDLVDRDVFGQKNTRHAYLCGRCWSVFDGSQDEWRHHATQREMHRKRQENHG